MKYNRELASEILFLTSFPPRACGIASFSKNLIDIITEKFNSSYQVKIGALETTKECYEYEDEVILKLNTDNEIDFQNAAYFINNRKSIKTVVLQHEFGFYHKNEPAFLNFLFKIKVPKILVFHTVLPNVNLAFKENVQKIVAASNAIVVMTKNSKEILVEEYGIPQSKVFVIPHGTHLIEHKDPEILKDTYGFKGKKILSTFGLLNSGKGIETTINALPDIVHKHPSVMFLILGATHPVVLENEGEKYRASLEQKVKDLKLENNVRFVNHYLTQTELLDYLQMTDIYLFTSIDPNQAVSGTFSYAMSCGCAIVSTPIPHAKEVLQDNTGLLIDFGNSVQLAQSVNKLLESDDLRKHIAINALQKINVTAWENAAIKYVRLFRKLSQNKTPLIYNLPKVNLGHIKDMTTDFGIIQFSKLEEPDLSTGYTIDDNARAMVALIQHYENTGNELDLPLIQTYLNFIEFCQQKEGDFLNYVNIQKEFTNQNKNTNLEDANGRTIWALGYLISKQSIFPEKLNAQAKEIMNKAIPCLKNISSPRAISFMIKGMYYRNSVDYLPVLNEYINDFANELLRFYDQESEKDWEWFESYLTYANSIMPEALLCAYESTHKEIYKKVAKSSFDFLLDQTFTEQYIKVISNKSWLYKGEEADIYGEQPIDVAYTILALSRFYKAFKDESYLKKMNIAFNWFLGQNHLHQIIYNPKTGGCYDGLEKIQVNLNQGAESTVSYLMARMEMENINQKTKILLGTNLLTIPTKAVTRK